jgi:hypothetical protein
VYGPGAYCFAHLGNFSGNIAEAVALMLSLSFVIDGADQPVFVLR